jgi:3-oxoacyl-[acyl-carrier protein] reductase
MKTSGASGGSPRPLEGRVALITGASRRAGIGHAIARRLARDGAQIALHGWRQYDREQAWGEDSPSEQDRLELSGSGTKLLTLEENLREPDAPARLAERVQRSLGRLDILVLNHVYSTRQTLEELAAEEIDRHLEINVRASLLLAREFARRSAIGAGGRIVFITSGQQLGPMPHELAYVASKGALHALICSLADHLMPRGITVNGVNPGPTDTGWADSVTQQRVQARMPQGRWGTPDDAARAVAWLVSDEAAWITGQVLNSEGGFRR